MRRLKKSQLSLGLDDMLLHSFWYEAAEAAFLEITEADPGCAMAHWGVAMTAVHPLWPGTPDYEKGKRATAKAVALGGGTPQEKRIDSLQCSCLYFLFFLLS